MPLSDEAQKILDKVQAGQALTDGEELIYFTEVLRYSEEEAKKLFSILSNNKPGMKAD